MYTVTYEVDFAASDKDAAIEASDALEQVILSHAGVVGVATGSVEGG